MTLDQIRALPDQQRMLKFYEKYNPSKTGEVEALYKKHAHKQAEMWAKLISKYAANVSQQEKEAWMGGAVAQPQQQAQGFGGMAAGEQQEEEQSRAPATLASFRA